MSDLCVRRYATLSRTLKFVNKKERDYWLTDEAHIQGRIHGGDSVAACANASSFCFVYFFHQKWAGNHNKCSQLARRNSQSKIIFKKMIYKFASNQLI